MVLISVPKGFDVQNLNTTKIDVKKKLAKAKKNNGSVVTKGSVQTK